MTTPPWWDGRAARRAQNASSARQERRHARDVGGKVQRGSGSSWRAKGDVLSGQFMDELKETDGRQFSITTTIMHKLFRAADQYGREPRLIVDFKSIGKRAVITFEDL